MATFQVAAVVVSLSAGSDTVAERASVDAATVAVVASSFCFVIPTKGFEIANISSLFAS